MKKLGMLGIIGGAALLTAAPFSLQWSQDEVSLLNSANAGVHRKVYRRTYRRAAYAAGYGYGSYYGYGSPYYPSYYARQPYSSYYGRPVSVRTIHYSYPPSRYDYYLPPFAFVSSYDPRIEVAPERTGHGLPLSKCEAYNRVYDQF